ncbi:MAG: response regulator transcription factor [Bacteroidia bacterium]|nr:response regulator transcription factor [Bacteroidia bacterium]
MAFTVLIVEDEKSISGILKLNLEMEGFVVLLAETGPEATELFQKNQESISIVLLDVMLPGLNGFEVCSFIKERKAQMPVIFLTAKGNSEDRIKGLKTGADDYLVKPFNLEELLLRINIVLKRSAKIKDTAVFEFGKNKIDFVTWEIKGVGGKSETISTREIKLLKLLTERKNEVVSRDEILEKLWDEDENPSSRTIDNLILNFRKYFEKNPREPQYFHSVRGVGYKFTC